MYICDFFFFKQKTAYEMRISDWSSDVCSSDLTTTVRCWMLGRRWPTRRSQCRAHHAERKFLMSVSTRKHTAPAGGKVAAVAVASLFAATALAGSALAQEVKDRKSTRLNSSH